MEQNKWLWLAGALIIGAILGFIIRGNSTVSPAIETETQSETPAVMQTDRPASGYDLHIDAEKHYTGGNEEVAHHYCKEVRGGMFECQLYESDDKDARLVGVEVVVDADTWSGFSASEKALWHYHKEEIPKVNAQLPDLSEEEAAQVVESLTETYGKIYILWNPAESDLPVGQPSVTVLE